MSRYDTSHCPWQLGCEIGTANCGDRESMAAASSVFCAKPPSMVQTQALCCGGIRRTLCAALWSRTPLPPQLRVIDAAPNPDYARERSAHLAFCVGFQEVESGTPDLVGEVLGIN